MTTAVKPALKIHPLMLAAVIAFWGWQTGQWLAAVPVAIVVCASFYVSLRWTFSAAQLYRVADFCTVLALLLGGFLYVTYGNPRAIILFFEWLPLLFLPVALAHAYGTAERMHLSVLFWSLRRRPPRDDEQRHALFDPWWPYYALWIVAAAAANVRGDWFYVGLIALVSWPLVRIRPWSYRVGTWGIAFSLAVALGYGLQYGLNVTQVWLEGAVPEWINASGSRTDPYRATTDIGHIGKLKESDTIVLRVTTPDGKAPPRLLHRASYNTYFGNAWFARGVKFDNVASASVRQWPLAAASEPAQRVIIHDYTIRPNPVLSLPIGAWAVENLDAISMQRNPLGAVQIVREPGFFSYVVAHAVQADARARDSAPNAEDLRLPMKEREAFEAVAAELGIKGLSPTAGVEAVQQFFAHGYQYSTFRKDALFTGSPMVDFLHRSKSGHCEYFATATALLLRAGGIPARYATGFVAAEKSDLENAWIVRTRHAHAWVRAYVNGAWIDVDTTPPAWLSIEAEDAGAWSKLGDWWAWLRFRASQQWAAGDGRTWLIGALIVVLPFAWWLARRLWRSRSDAKKYPLKQIVTLSAPTGKDSEFYRIEQQLREQGLGRHAHETANDWLARLRSDATGARINTDALAEIVELHNRYRFDPAGLSEMQRARLKDSASGWLGGSTNTANP